MSNLQVPDFSTEVSAKWVLSGEHSVLRGKRALAFPYPAFSLKLNFRDSEKLSAVGNPHPDQILQLISRGCTFLGKNLNLFSSGEISIQSAIPIGAGLGSSAAISVAMAKLIIWKTDSSISDLIPLATHLEDVFHGKSSGMDVNVIAHAQPILFSMGKKSEELLALKKFPRFELQDSGKRGKTKFCIESVNRWRVEQSEKADRLDEQMGQATEMAAEALRVFDHDPKSSEKSLALAMTTAQNCFEAWGLVPADLIAQKDEILKRGALSVKLTGAGLGGFWVALWPS